MTTLVALSLFGLLAAANPLPLPTPPPLEDKKACTHTVTSYVYGFTGDWSPTETTTAYTATETVETSIDCGGCENLATYYTRAALYGGIGPQVHMETVTGTGKATATQTVCAKAKETPTYSHHGAIPVVLPPEGPPTTSVPASVPTPPPAMSSTIEDPTNCTSIKMVPFHMTLGPVKTVWAATSTITQGVDCGGTCRHVLTRTAPNRGGHGPVVIFKTTVTAAEPSMETHYTCMTDGLHTSGRMTLPVEPTGLPINS